MWLLYIFSLIPLTIGFVLWLTRDEVHWVEWLSGSAAAFILAGIVHACAISGMVTDKEVWSGEIIHATFYPEWIEEYQEAHTYTTTDSDGNSTTHTYYTTEHRTHEEYWEAYTDLDYSKGISKEFFKEIVMNFNNLTTERPHKGGFDGGDPHIYVAYNKTGFIYPVTDIRRFSNRIKAAPTVFSFPSIPETVQVYSYPYPGNWRQSNRLINEKNISILEFDRLNSRLGFKKQVNLIMINFDERDSSIAQYQEAKFIGGKKNDLVLCYGKRGNKANWAYCFGWTEEALCKRNLETILLNNRIDDSILPIIEKEVIKSYIRKDWHKFDYITIEPRNGTYTWFFVLMIITQGTIWGFFFFNDLKRDDSLNGYSYRKRYGGGYWR